MADEKDLKTASKIIDTVNSIPPQMNLPIDDIIVDPSFNVRQQMTAERQEARERLKDDIAKNGLTTPLIVERTPKGYELRAGFTRIGILKELAAETRKLGGKTVEPITVRVQLRNFTDPAESHLFNVADNALREGLSPYEIAAKAAYVAETFDMKGVAIARGMGLAPKYINNLLNAYRSLDPRLLDKWKDGEITYNFATKLMSLEHDAQWEQYRLEIGELVTNDKGEIVEAGADDDDHDDDDTKTKKTDTQQRPRQAVLEAAMRAVRASDESDEWKRGAMQALGFANGDTKKLGTVYDPKKAQADKNGKARGGAKSKRTRPSAEA